MRNSLGEDEIALAKLPKRVQNPAVTTLFYFKIIDRKNLKSYISVVRKAKPGHGNRDLRGWPRVSDKVQLLCATPVTNAGAGAVPTTVMGSSALRGADVIWFNT